MVENQKVFRERCSAIPVDLRQSVMNLLEIGWIQARPEKDRAKRVDIATGRSPAKKHRLQQGGPPPHKWVVDEISGLSESFDEEARQLGFKTRPVGHFVQRARSSLFGCPELIFQNRDCLSGVDGRMTHGR